MKSIDILNNINIITIKTAILKLQIDKVKITSNKSQ